MGVFCIIQPGIQFTPVLLLLESQDPQAVGLLLGTVSLLTGV